MLTSCKFALLQRLWLVCHDPSLLTSLFYTFIEGEGMGGVRGLVGPMAPILAVLLASKHCGWRSF